MNVLSAEELLAWVDRTSSGWQSLLVRHPEVLLLPCTIREGQTAGDLVHHIVAAELRYAERLCGRAQTPYESIPKGVPQALYATHELAMSLLRDLLERGDVDWEGSVEFSTRKAGVLRASRRTVLVHLLMHSIRHYAQLATVARQGGAKPDWEMDYLAMGLR